MESTLQRLHRKNKTGSIHEVAVVLRDLYILSVDKDLSYGERKMMDTAKNLLVTEISLARKVDESKIEKMIEDKMKEQESGRHQAYPSIRRTGAKIQKILLSLQKIDKKDFLIGTVFISGLGMIKVKIDLDLEHRSVYPNVQNFGAKIVEFEKKSFLI